MRLLSVLLLTATLASAQDLKQPPSVLEDPEAQGIGKPPAVPALKKHLAGKRLLVAAFTATTCPLSKIYRPRLERLAGKYAARGVAFVYIHGDADDAPPPGPSRLPRLHDADGVLASALGARRTTDVLLLDASGVLRYRGALDDQYGIGYAKEAPDRAYVVDAIDAVLAGRKIRIPATEAPGCMIESKPVADAGAAVTYHRDVAPILLRSCSECHRPGEIGPFSLLTYAQAKAKARTMLLAVDGKRMPPWFANPEHGRWANDRSLSDRDRATLKAWVDGGCAEGDPRESPTVPEREKGWAMGTPDQVWAMPAEVRVPEDGILPYKYYTVRTRLKEDRWVRAIEVRPGARDVVHHVLVFVQYPPDREDAPPAFDGGLNMGYFGVMVPGERPTLYPEDMGKRIPAGAKLVFQIHYTAVGEAQWDRTAIGVRYWDRPPAREVMTRGIVNIGIKIPPGAPNHQEQALYHFEHDARILGFLPHMHLRGKAFRYTAEYPDGTKEILLDIPRYDFNWQLYYHFAEPKRVKAGTRIRASAWFDNSPDNPANPDPAATVTFGEQTWDEMLIGYMDFVKE